MELLGLSCYKVLEVPFGIVQKKDPVESLRKLYTCTSHVEVVGGSALSVFEAASSS